MLSTAFISVGPPLDEMTSQYFEVNDVLSRGLCISFRFKSANWEQGDSSVGKALVVQAGGLESDLQSPNESPGVRMHSCNPSSEEVETAEGLLKNGRHLGNFWPLRACMQV